MLCDRQCCVLFSLLAADCAVAGEVAVDPESVLDEIVVTATRTERNVLSVPGTTSVIDVGTMERRLNRTLKDLVRYEPGVTVQNDPLRFGLGGFNIRGMDRNRVQMVVDGVRIPDAYSLGTFQSARRNMVDVDALKKVEIVRGPGSALYGSDGIGGVVNFVTKDPRDYLDLFGRSTYAGLKLLYGSAADNFSQTATFAGAKGPFEGLLLLTHVDGAENDNKGTVGGYGIARTKPNPQDSRTLNLLGKLIYRFSDDNRLRLTGEATADEVHTDVAHLYGDNFAGRNVYRFLTHDRQSRWRVSLDQSVRNLGFSWLDSFDWRVYGQQTRTRQRVDEARTTVLLDAEQVRRLFRYDQSQFGGEIQGAVSFDLGPTHHRLISGVEALRTDIEELRSGSLKDLDTLDVSATVAPDTFPVRDFPLSETRRAGVFWQDEIALFDRRMELLPALRFDYFGLRPRIDPIYAKDNKGNPPVAHDFTELSPKFGALLHLTEQITLHGQYAEGFRAPNFSDANSGFVNFTFGYASIPNPNLSPETSDGGELGLRFESAAVKADASFFRNEYQGFIQNVVACDPAKAAVCPPFNLLTYKTINTPDPVRIEGFEFKGEVRGGALAGMLEGFTLLGSFSLAEGRNLGTRRPISSVNPLRGVMGLRFDAGSGTWGGEAMLTLAAPKRAAAIDPESAGAVFPTTGYGVVDLTAYYRPTDHISLNAGLFNLFDKTYFEWEDVRSRGADPHAGLAGAADIRDRYSRPGRNVSVSLRVEF